MTNIKCLIIPNDSVECELGVTRKKMENELSRVGIHGRSEYKNNNDRGPKPSRRDGAPLNAAPTRLG
jgi:hypothetical protein